MARFERAARGAVRTFALAIVGVATIIFVTATWIGASEDGGGYAGPDSRALAAEGSGDLISASTTIIRTLPDQARDMEWRIYQYATTSYPECHDAVAFSSSTGDYLGFVGGCGSQDALNTDPYYYAGWVESPTGDRAFLTFGFIPLARRGLVDKVTWERSGAPATRVTDRAVQGVWAFVTDSPAAAKVRLLDPARNVVDTHNIPDLDAAPDGES